MKIYLFVIVVVALLSSESAARAQTPNRAGIVVQFSNGTVTTRCVQFNEASITGYDLIRRSKLPIAVDFGSFGAAVCKIGNEGCSFPAQSCFCQCEKLDGNCTYWVYSQLDAASGAWTISGRGAGNRVVRNGDVDGWRWGKGNGDPSTNAQDGEVPASVTLDSVCSASAIAQMRETTKPTTEPTTASTPTQIEPTLTATSTAFATDEPTRVALPTAQPTATVRLGTRTTPTLVSTSVMPATSIPVPTSQPSNQTTDQLLPYLAFGAIALGLLGALALARRAGGKS